MTDRLAVARRAAEAGAEVAVDRFEGPVTPETKSSAMDYVTEADVSAQAAVVETIREGYPAEPVVGEEGDAPKTVPETGEAWIDDPIDGTTNFLHGFRTWGTAVAAVRDGDPVAGAVVLPALDDTYLAGESARHNGSSVAVSDQADVGRFVAAPILRYTETEADRERFARLTEALIRGVGDLRRLGCAQATLAMVAAGVLDATVGPFAADPWDTVAGAHMVERAGGTVTDLGGDPWRPDSVGVVASNGRAHGALLDVIDAADLD